MAEVSDIRIRQGDIRLTEAAAVAEAIGWGVPSRAPGRPGGGSRA
jgi:hypothetical protein